jgi:glycosyltransferase involved in cell wall biosynthesis
MRYIWTQYEEYFGKGRAGLVTRLGMRAALPGLRRWDLRTAAHPHHFVAISENIRRRIREIYNRESDVIYSPVDTAAFSVSSRDDGFFLMVSALVPYKAVDLAVEAFNRLGHRLVIIGDGPDLPRLRELAHRNVEFLGWQDDAVVRDHFARCHAVVFPGEEDFGIVPVEAMACGKPVVALARGGALETVLDTSELRTGVLFPESTVDSLMDAVRRLGLASFDQAAMRAWALRFDRETYKRNMEAYILERWRLFRE